MKIFSAAQLYEADKITTEKQQITSVDLMERAASQIFNWLHQRMQGAQVPIHIFCGIGNNGGDGLALGRILIEHGYNVHVYIANFTDKRSKCFLINYGRIKDVTKNWPHLMSSAEDFPEIHQDDIIIDALFGIGLNRPIEGWVKELVQYLNQEKAFKLSIDIPSGLSANEPLMDPEAVIKANHTLTFQAPKLSFFMAQTGVYVPYFEALDIGLDAEYLVTTQPVAQVVVKPMAKTFYKQREKYAHKGHFGHVAVVGGSYGKIGAPIMTTQAALRAGAGLATAIVPKCGYAIMQTTVPEAMVQTDSDTDKLTQVTFNFKPTTIVMGMAMGTAPETLEAFRSVLVESDAPMVLDADAINCISVAAELIKEVPKFSILTPHDGELERLIGGWNNDFEKLDKAKAYSAENEVILVLKGANTMTVFGQQVMINSTGNPGMATAGSGDVLSGMIGGLLAQGYDPLVAAVFGVYLHGSAGNIVSQETGFEALVAGDIIDFIGRAFLSLFEQEPPPPGEEQQQ